jgi:hypothetical protein
MDKTELRKEIMVDAGAFSENRISFHQTLDKENKTTKKMTDRIDNPGH